MKGFLIGRIKNKHNQAVALKIYFPTTKQVWLMDAEEVKRRYKLGVMPEVVGIKFRQAMDLDSTRIHLCGSNGLYNAQKVDIIDGKGDPINGEPIMWNIVGTRGFEEFKRYICVNSACKEKEFDVDELKKLIRAGRINGARLLGDVIQAQNPCNQQIYDY